MEYVGTYGRYSHNTSESYKKSRASKWKDDKGIYYYKSYNTIIAFEVDGMITARQNDWSTTTGKHLNWISSKKYRLPSDKFEAELKKVQGRPAD